MSSIGKPEFTPTISIGNIVQICSTIAIIAVGWGYLQQKVAANTGQYERISTMIELEFQQAKRDDEAVAARVRELETQSARMDERFTLILTLMGELKQQVSELPRNSRDNDSTN